FVLLFLSISVFSFLGSIVSSSHAGQLVYSTFLGGINDEKGEDIAIDSSGNAYIVGYSASPDFPAISGGFDTSFNGSNDVFITKLNPTGSGLVYSTYLGGSSSDYGLSIALDNLENAYITGYTWSTDFPITPGAFDTIYHHCFVSKLNAEGTELVYSTYLGGFGGTEGYAIAVDHSGNAYITGETSSLDFPTTPGAFDTTCKEIDAFVTKLNASGTALIYSTFLGGEFYDAGFGITVDSSDHAYVTGYTRSTEFPTTPGAYSTSFNGRDYDAFITKFNDEGTGLIYSTYLGGESNDYGWNIALDKSEHAYVTGMTNSGNFPTTPGAINSRGENYDVFVSKLYSTGTGLVYSAIFGGEHKDEAFGIAIDKSGNVYLTGWTSSPDFPTTPDAYDTTFHDGGRDAFVTEINLTGMKLLYSSYLGSGSDDGGFAIAIDTLHNAYITGYATPTTEYCDFPTTSGAFDTSFNSGPYSSDAFVTKMSLLPYVNSYGEFTAASDTNYWYFEKYGDGISAGNLSWSSGSQFIMVTLNPGEKGKLSQVFSVPRAGWYTATANVISDISEIAKQQKVYLCLQELDSSTSIIATGSHVVEPGAGGLAIYGWKHMQISVYAKNTVLSVQVVSINPTNSGVTGSLWIDDIWVTPGGPQSATTINLTNPSFDEGTVGWIYDIYADGIGTGVWSGWNGLLLGTQAGGEKCKISQVYSVFPNQTLGSVWVYSGATSMLDTQKVYL
ncbi:MAG: SBBP repeat-containing protein, partial [bacterium]